MVATNLVFFKMFLLGSYKKISISSIVSISIQEVKFLLFVCTRLTRTAAVHRIEAHTRRSTATRTGRRHMACYKCLQIGHAQANCMFCDKCAITAKQKLLRTLHPTDPRSVSDEYLIKYLNDNHTEMTPALDAATKACVAKQRPTVPVVITAVLKPADGTATELPVMV